MSDNLKTVLTGVVLAIVSTGSALYAYAADSKPAAPSGAMMEGMMQGGHGDMPGMMNMMQQMNQMMESCNTMMKEHMSNQPGADTPKGQKKPAQQS